MADIDSINFEELLQKFADLDKSDSEVKIKVKSGKIDYTKCECGSEMEVSDVDLVCHSCGLSKQAECIEVFTPSYAGSIPGSKAQNKKNYAILCRSEDSNISSLRQQICAFMKAAGVDLFIIEKVIDEYKLIAKYINKKGNKHKALVYLLTVNNYAEIYGKHIDSDELRSKFNIDIKNINAVQKNLEAIITKEKINVTRVSSKLEDNEKFMISNRLLALSIEYDKYISFILDILAELNNPVVSKTLSCAIQSKINAVIYILAKTLNPLIHEETLLKKLSVTDKVIISGCINIIITSPSWFGPIFRKYSIAYPTSQSMRKKRTSK